MPSRVRKTGKVLTSIRLDAEDRHILAALRKLTGQPSSSAIFRLAIREALAARQLGHVGDKALLNDILKVISTTMSQRDTQSLMSALKRRNPSLAASILARYHLAQRIAAENRDWAARRGNIKKAPQRLGQR